ncbi:accessory Sec system protein Asp3 [Microbacterium stercoris]|uniref:Accessory Sec system protein Asp3 n=1 Tax=Microbacterium stercoris TaxID=2820289 RepID=A0A939TPL7_9MICO|nr:accessory Sec system protein Asp3 [Microbacterium stercoris]MBO3662206.1 accessory Sec system protein Asp3 [Microbacterium stercoris]
MADELIATVRWGSLNSRAALYGSVLSVDPSGEVHLANRLMPSGTTLQEWYSFTDYQAVREAPTLPLLRGGASYRLEPELRTAPADSVVFDVRYFDRFDELLRVDVLHAPRYEFSSPPECHHYTIRLANAGCDELWFTSFALREGDADAE